MHTLLHAALALISKQAHLLTTAHAVNTVQIKVNGTDPYMAMVCLHIGLLHLIGYAALVCVEYGLIRACQYNRILLRCVLPTTVSCIVSAYQVLQS